MKNPDRNPQHYKTIGTARRVELATRSLADAEPDLEQLNLINPSQYRGPHSVTRTESLKESPKTGSSGTEAPGKKFPDIDISPASLFETPGEMTGRGKSAGKDPGREALAKHSQVLRP
jgi:hypothetical protein